MWAPLFVKRAWNFKLLGAVFRFPFSATRRGADPLGGHRKGRRFAVGRTNYTTFS